MTNTCKYPNPLSFTEGKAFPNDTDCSDPSKYCKCKSEIERFKDAVMKANRIYTESSWSEIDVNRSGSINFRLVYFVGVECHDVSFDTLAEFEAWSDTLSSGCYHEIIHRRYDDILRRLR